MNKSLHLILIGITGFLLLLPCPSRAGLDAGLEQILLDLQATMYPPMLYEVKLDPEKPSANSPVKIHAVIHNERELTDDETMSASVLYSIDGGKKWTELEMEQGDDETSWTAEIPGQSAGTEVLYYFRAEDTSYNIYTERTCMVTREWPPIEDPCMVQGAQDDDPVDDNSVVMEDAMDILESKIGEDEKYFYIQIKVQGKVSPGTASPVYLMAYGGALENPDRRGQDVLQRGIAYIYGPLAKVINFDPCLTVIQRGGDVVYGPNGITCAAKDQYMMFRLEKDFVGDNPSGWVKFVNATAVINDFNIENIPVIPKDYSNVTRFERVSRSYTVGQ